MDEPDTPEETLDNIASSLSGLVQNTEITATQAVEKIEDKLEGELKQEKIQKEKELHKPIGE